MEISNDSVFTQISKPIKRALDAMGFEEATPIQQQSIPVVLAGKDIIGQAQTGTGKTAAFGIPMLERTDRSKRILQSLVLCPTRELAIQIAEELKRLTKFLPDIDVLPVYGGQSIDRQILGLRRGAQIVVGTPGRVMDHLRRKTLNPASIRMVVLDEADEMLDMGFREDIEVILNQVPKERQTVLFSATMSKPILELARKYLQNPEHIRVARNKELTVPTIEQYYMDIKPHAKVDTLTRLIDQYAPKLSLVFCNTKRRVDDLVEELQARGYAADGLHGDLRQSSRDTVMGKFRRGVVEVLVATDVAARGIDVDNIEAVFNYDVPSDEEYYVHRIGRTGRAGRVGKAFTFCVGRDIYKIRDIQHYAHTKILFMRAPSLHDIEETKASALLERVKAELEKGDLAKYVAWTERLVEEDYSSLEVAAALIRMAMRPGKTSTPAAKKPPTGR